MAIYVITFVVISKSQLEHSRIWNCDLCRWIVLGKTVCISNDCVIGSSEAWKYLHVNMNFIYKAFIYAIDFDCIENDCEVFCIEACTSSLQIWFINLIHSPMQNAKRVLLNQKKQKN